MISSLETDIVAVERMKEYAETEQVSECFSINKTFHSNLQVRTVQSVTLSHTVVFKLVFIVIDQFSRVSQSFKFEVPCKFLITVTTEALLVAQYAIENYTIIALA